MKLIMNWQNFGDVFVVPKELLNKYIHRVDNTYIKVILFICSTSGQDWTMEGLAGETNIPMDKLQGIIDFWAAEEMIFPLDGKEKETPKLIGEKKHLTSVLSLKKEEYTAFALHDEEVKFLLNKVQNMLGRTITYAECNILVSIQKLYGLPADVILMLLSYCVSTGKDNFNYIRKTAIDWSNQEINTFEKAEQHILYLESQNKSESMIKNLFGIYDRSLSNKERQLADLWIQEKGIHLDLILEAYERCIANIGKISFVYMNKILVSWESKGITTPKDLEKMEYQKEMTAQPSYDLNEMEEMMMNYTPVYLEEDKNEV